jgi:hypothetical protein
MARPNWTPTTNPVILRRMGRTGEEAAKLIAITNRCISQELDETDPETGEPNRRRLIVAIGELQAQLACTITALDLPTGYIAQVTAYRIRQMREMGEWEAKRTPIPDCIAKLV